MDDILTSITSGDCPRNWTQEWLVGHVHAPSGTNGTLRDERDNFEDNQGFATRLYSLCLCLLRYLCRQEQNIASKRHRVSTLKEELGRLYLWGEAFKNGKLDRALEYSDDVRGNVLDSLRDIGKLLLRGLCPSSTSVLLPSSLQNDIHELKYLVEQIKVITSTRNHAAISISSDWEDESDTDEENSSDDDNTTDIVEELRLQTQWLTQLGPILEQNLVSVQKTRIEASLPAPVPFSVSGPAGIYVSLVREKYKQAQDQLVERLGEANWQRHISVRRSMEASANIAEETTAPIADSAVARSVFRPYSAFHDSGIGPSIPAQTEYAPSHTSFQSSNTEGERELVRVPATPMEVNDGKPFQCFLCKCVLSDIKNRVDWKMHVFADLQPYICTFADCQDELAQFPNRAAWAEHEFSQHRITRSWNCPECPQAFVSVSKWQTHVQEKHCLFFSGHNFNFAKDMAYRSEAIRIEDDECPLCRTVVGKPRRTFVKHVGRHMEEIALMALPRNVEEDSEEDSLSTDRTSLEKSRKSSHAQPSITTEDAVRYTSFACEQCDQTFLESRELIAHGKVHSLRPKTRARDIRKCSACRFGKTKCTPHDRNWENSQQKCDRCEKCELPCGPNLRLSEDPAIIRQRTAVPEDILDPSSVESLHAGGRDRKDLYGHIQEGYGKSIDFDTKPISIKAPIKALPTIRTHINGHLNHEGDEYILSEYDSSGERKVSPLGFPLGGRLFNIRTFHVLHRGDKQFMLATECARVLGYRDSYLLFNENRSLYNIIATLEEKEALIDVEILPYQYRSRQVALVTAKSIFRRFGARVIQGGRRVRDDYWEAKAINDGYTENDLPSHKLPRSAEIMGAAGQAEHSNNGVAQNSPASAQLLIDTAHPRGTEGAATALSTPVPYPGDTKFGDWNTTLPGLVRDDAATVPNVPFVYPGDWSQESGRKRGDNAFLRLAGHIGRVDALGPPSQEHPTPAPPLRLSQALLRLQQAYPDDLFEATMRYTGVSTKSGLPISVRPFEPVPPDTKHTYYPRIKCLDCPEKLYIPGPDLSAKSFEVHLGDELHRQKVEKRLRAREPGSDKPGTEPQVSSFWSVPEQVDFNKYLRFFGTNWKAIAAAMKTKTEIDVKDFYNRKIQEGYSGQQLEEEAQRADALRASGIDMGPQPAPAPMGSESRYRHDVKKETTESSRTEDVDVVIEPPDAQ